MSNRCAICDYLEGFGSELYSIFNDGRKVHWREEYSEYQCDDCFHSIRYVYYSKPKDPALVAEEEIDDEIRGIQASLSTLPIE